MNECRTKRGYDTNVKLLPNGRIVRVYCGIHRIERKEYFSTTGLSGIDIRVLQNKHFDSCFGSLEKECAKADIF